MGRASTIALVLGLGVSLAGIAAHTAQPASHDWPTNGGAANDHYSDLTQINRDNVTKLTVAWTYDTGEGGGLEDSPIVVGNVLYTGTPSGGVIALDAATGKVLWKFTPEGGGRALSRGVSYWTDGRDSRIFSGFRNYLYALDASTGKPIPTFWENGRIDLRKGLREPYERQSVTLTTPGTVYKDLIIVGGANPETHPAPPGDIRAFDVRTGALRWTFHTIPHPGELGYDTWPKDAWQNAGAANNWAGMTVDTRRGIVYVPTGSAVFDFYGGDRVGDDLFADQADCAGRREISGARPAFPGRSPRSLGPRLSRTTGSADGETRGQACGCDRADNEVRVRFPLRPLDWQVAVSTAGIALPSQHGPGRGCLSCAIAARLTRSLYPAKRDRGHAYQSHCRSTCVGGQAVPFDDRRGTVRSP